MLLNTNNCSKFAHEFENLSQTYLNFFGRFSCHSLRNAEFSQQFSSKIYQKSPLRVESLAMAWQWLYRFPSLEEKKY